MSIVSQRSDRRIESVDPDPHVWVLMMLAGISAASGITNAILNGINTTKAQSTRARTAFRHFQSQLQDLIDAHSDLLQFTSRWESTIGSDWQHKLFQPGEVGFYADFRELRQWFQRMSRILDNLYAAVLDFIEEAGSGTHHAVPLDLIKSHVKQLQDSYANLGSGATYETALRSIAHSLQVLTALAKDIEKHIYHDRGRLFF